MSGREISIVGLGESKILFRGLHLHDDVRPRLTPDAVFSALLSTEEMAVKWREGLFFTESFDDAKKFSNHSPKFVLTAKITCNLTLLDITPSSMDLLIEKIRNQVDFSADDERSIAALSFLQHQLSSNKTPTKEQEQVLAKSLKHFYPSVNGFQRRSFFSTGGEEKSEYCLWSNGTLSNFSQWIEILYTA